MGKKWKKQLSLGIAASLCLTMVFSAFPPQSAKAAEAEVKTSFTDMSEAHWANKFVSKLALLQVINGYQDGSFKPNQEVSQQDVLLMAIKMMGIDAEAEVEGIAYSIPLFVKDYAREEVYLALKKGLIQVGEEQSLLEDGEEWGTKGASREWVARVLVRALTQEEPIAQVNLNERFGDADEVSAWALPYVKRAVELGLLNGKDGQIAPQMNVTRAEMATLFNQLEPLLEQSLEDVREGRVVSLSGQKIQLQMDGGEVKSYNLHDEVKFFDVDQNKEQISADQIGLYDKVYVIIRHDEVYYVEHLEEAQLNTTEGKFVQLNTDEMNLTLLVDGQYRVFKLSAATTVIDTEENGLNLSNLVPSSKLRVSQNPYEEGNKVVSIDVLEVPVNKTAKGTFESLENDQLNARNLESNETESFDLSEEIRYTYGEKTIEAAQLQSGDLVEYVIVNSVVTAVKLIDPVVPLLETFEGTYIGSEYDAKLGAYFVSLRSENNKPVAYYTDKNIKVQLEGKDKAELNDLISQDRVQVTINEKEDIVAIQILNRSVESKIQQKVLYYNEENGKLLLDSSDTLFVVGPETDITAYGVPIQRSNAGNYLVENKKIDIIYSGNQLMEINITNSYAGTVQKVDTSRKEIQVLGKDGHLHTFKWSSYLVVDLIGSSSATINNVKIGDEVTVILDSNQQFATRVEMSAKKVYTLTGVTPSSSRLEWKDEKGTNTTKYIASNIKITNASGQTITLGELKKDDRLIAFYQGSTLKELRRADGYLGYITSVDTVNSKIQLMTYSGTSVTLTVPSGASLASGDRVEVVKDSFTVAHIMKLESETRTFWKYIGGTTNELHVKKKSVSDQDYIFKLNDDVVFTKDGQLTQVTALKENDKVTLYFYQGELIEVKIS
ncbi:S-layer homology domain-containing protein [Marinicrinis sediminis]|uniref:S-layer homology domain-containing protein n=1 Tax=Marinicrinis sediminis TaxID=1652465 RepID=A0ABW5REF6_9BACL